MKNCSLDDNWSRVYSVCATVFFKQAYVQHTRIIYVHSYLLLMHIINHIRTDLRLINLTKQTKFSIISIFDVIFFIYYIYDFYTADFTQFHAHMQAHTHTHTSRTNASLWRSRAHLYECSGKFHSHHMAAYGHGQCMCMSCRIDMFYFL